MNIKDHMPLLTDAEITGGIRAFSEARDRYAKEGRHGLAGVYSALAYEFKAEQIRRKELFNSLQREMASSEFTWGNQCS